MKLEVHRYVLKSRTAAALNARSERRSFPGALIRMDGIGVACVHPWPELGDASLEAELAALAAGCPLRLGQCALVCAEWDALARRQQRSLFAGLSIPRSHWTVGFGDDPAQVAAQGFTVAKLKLGADVSANVRQVEHWAATEALEHLRLDANETMTPAQFIDFAGPLSPAARRRIEFVEDPTPFDGAVWQDLEAETGLRLAADRIGLNGKQDEEWRGPRVVKPARDSLDEIENLLETSDSMVVFTSYMDHAIGQMWAAFVAAKHGGYTNVSPHAGLLTHPLFESDLFFERLRCEGPRLLPSEGTGLGFDKLLEKLPWTPLN